MCNLQPVNIVAGAAFIVGSAILAGAVDVAMLVVGRVLLGIGVGLCSLVSRIAVLLFNPGFCVCVSASSWGVLPQQPSNTAFGIMSCFESCVSLLSLCLPHFPATPRPAQVE